MDKGQQQELFEEIKAKNDIVEVISEYVTLKRSGRSFLGLCPFHSEKTPSFNVNQSKQFFYCFGCGAGGDIFSFLMKLENLEFIEVARRLAERSGITWPEIREFTETERKRADLVKINRLVAIFYNHCLVKSELGKQARQYLEQRGINEGAWERFGIGYAPPGWHTLTEVLRRKGVSLEQAESIGLVGFGEHGYYDRFRDRIIFPIAEPKGNVIGFGGRVMEPAVEPKYLNSPETPLFHKGNSWYALNLAKDTIKRSNQAILMEGYLDVIQAHQAGFTQAIASLGTALTKEQVGVLGRFTSEAILAYDADTAGQNATIRGMDILQQAGLRVKILNLPSGEDPDSFIKQKGAALFKERLEQALPLTDYKIKLVLETYNLKTPEAKSEAISAVFPQIATVESSVTREAYIRQLAREVGVSEAAILSEFQAWVRKHRKKSPVLDNKPQKIDTKEMTEKMGLTIGEIDLNKLTPMELAIFKAERELLNSILQEYEKFERIKEELKAEDFTFQPWRDFYNQLLASEVPTDGWRSFLEAVIGPLREIAATLAAEQELTEGRISFTEARKVLKMLHLQAKVHTLTEQINMGKDEKGADLSEAELKAKLTEFTNLRRQLSKEYPNFMTDI